MSIYVGLIEILFLILYDNKGDYMIIKKLKYNYRLLLILFCLVMISLLSIYSAESLLIDNSFFIKQIMWYLIGIIFMILILYIGNKSLFKYSFYLYIIGNILLFLLLIFGTPINDAKCWFTIPFIGSFQPSEFMKIILIIYLAKTIDKFNTDYHNPTIKDEFVFLLKIIFIVGIPSLLTFLEPDTGVVLIYLIITVTMLFISGIRIRWFILLFSFIILLLVIILGTYFFSQNLFIKIFGTDFFLRVDRLLDWSKNLGYQLENGLTAIGSGGLLGHGFNNTPIYFPEPQTDFIFAVFASNFGFIGGVILLVILLLFDLELIRISFKVKNIDKYIIGGTLGMLIYQQFQNIGMTLGILPITGITLPFISYGGSSLLSYILIISIILNMNKKKLH